MPRTKIGIRWRAPGMQGCRPFRLSLAAWLITGLNRELLAAKRLRSDPFRWPAGVRPNINALAVQCLLAPSQLGRLVSRTPIHAACGTLSRLPSITARHWHHWSKACALVSLREAFCRSFQASCWAHSPQPQLNPFWVTKWPPSACFIE